MSTIEEVESQKQKVPIRKSGLNIRYLALMVSLLLALVAGIFFWWRSSPQRNVDLRKSGNVKISSNAPAKNGSQGQNDINIGKSIDVNTPPNTSTQTGPQGQSHLNLGESDHTNTTTNTSTQTGSQRKSHLNLGESDLTNTPPNTSTQTDSHGQSHDDDEEEEDDDGNHAGTSESAPTDRIFFFKKMKKFGKGESAMYGLYSIGTEGSDLKLVWKAKGYFAFSIPHFNYESKKVIFSANFKEDKKKPNVIKVLSLEIDQTTQKATSVHVYENLTNVVWHPSWSRNGDRIVMQKISFNSDNSNGILVTDVDGKIVTEFNMANKFLMYPKFGCDHDHIIVVIRQLENCETNDLIETQFIKYDLKNGGFRQLGEISKRFNNDFLVTSTPDKPKADVITYIGPVVIEEEYVPPEQIGRPDATVTMKKIETKSTAIKTFSTYSKSAIDIYTAQKDTYIDSLYSDKDGGIYFSENSTEGFKIIKIGGGGAQNKVIYEELLPLN